MIKNSKLSAATYSKIDDLLRIGGAAISKAQDESRRMGVPNVYSIRGRLYYETPTGELSTSDPYPANSDSTE
jgi:hypothetical protein